MTEIVKTFEDHNVRIIDQNGEPWFVLKDVCDVLGIQDARQVEERLENDEKLMVSNTTSLSIGQRGGWIINESGLYSVILRSDKPEAKRFKKWVTSEVLPAIRKTGSYTVQPLVGPALISAALIEAHRVLEQQAGQIEAMKPAAQFYADVTGSRSAISMAEAAKVIGMGIGRNQLFGILREKKVLRENNEPYQKYIDLGWFRVVEQKWSSAGTGETNVSIKTLVYQKGIEGIIKIIRETKK